MPELPEVETIRRQLETLIGVGVESVEYPPSKIARGEIEKIEGQKIISVRRFGKLLLIDFSNELSMAVHLKMTGRLNLLEAEDPEISHTHITFSLSDGRRLSFADMRRFGFVHVMNSDIVSALPFLQTLGKEPLKDLTLADFEVICKRSNRPIKNLLLDQQKIAGIGNIYDCEALWISKIDPQRKANSLQSKEMRKLFEAIEAVLTEGIERGGASDNSYRNLLGGKGEYQNFFKVYGQTGKPCPRCGHKIERIALGGRGTFFCPHCQK